MHNQYTHYANNTSDNMAHSLYMPSDIACNITGILYTTNNNESGVYRRSTITLTAGVRI